MVSANSLNWEQHIMTAGHVKSLKTDKDRRDVLIRAISSGHPMIAEQRRNNHIVVHVKDDGSITTSGSGGSGNRGVENFESQLRRAHKSVGSDFPRKSESDKQFQRRMANKQKPNEETPESGIA
jgi:hypothetical protein